MELSNRFKNSTLIIGFILGCIVPNQLLAQAKMELQETTHDFGTVQEEDGPILHEFIFTNIGDAPLLISTVKASCGCTTPDWTKIPVLPGETGYIRAQYNPRNRPGSFSKSLRIMNNGEGGVAYAYIKGTVIPRVKTVEEELPLQIGALRIKSKSVSFGRMTNEKAKSMTMEVYNAGEDSLTFTDEYDGPTSIVVSVDPKQLAPKQKGEMTVTYTPAKNDLGSINYGITIYTDETEMERKNLDVRASVREYFAPLTDEEKGQAPALLISDKLQNVGRITQGQTVTAEFALMNSGNSKLNFRKVESNCACLVAELADYDLKPGKTTTLKMTFDTSNRRGTQNKTVYLYTNDPVNSTQVVTIRATIVN
ncbi:hypothetical protein BFP72_07060 [Reichenbachiella sp. 5M10]|uniref:DUF1573 domain-containing protein n=1 Tax=Reichenbachiella sp. 5M10 TaxID=1889772 RepID=UPI000C15BAD8|nr:DUF1573 domain-containing protein [Reichenbachiella sp. 5M10]PIB35171.1 hypothetical protein BFP72_07060 [Reichenbachiella sp. 5M10]